LRGGLAAFHIKNRLFGARHMLGSPRQSLRFCNVIYLQLRARKIHLTAAEETIVMSSSR